MKTELAIVGAGPAGLAAAVEAARLGVQVTVIDENLRPGGQLFKQIHKFFGSSEHMAGTRGVDIGRMLLGQCDSLGAEVKLGTVAYGLFEPRTIGTIESDSGPLGKRKGSIQAERIILATGAVENSLAFPGWTLPGVMTAGAAQTFMNVHRALPGRKVLVVGAGNVGLIVSYQLLQAGAEVAAVVEALPRIGGYGVHAAKLTRVGVPFLTRHTVVRATGAETVEEVVVAELDEKGKPIPGTERAFAVDTICLAVGLTPVAELAWMIGCRFKHISALGGQVPVHNEDMETTLEGIYVAGDIAGVEEASTAMEEGRLAGIAAAEAMGFLKTDPARAKKDEIRERLWALRQGPFGYGRRAAKQALIEEWYDDERRSGGNGNNLGIRA